MSEECQWKFKLGDRVVVTDDKDDWGGGEGDWNRKALGMEGVIDEVDHGDPSIPYRVVLDEEHPEHNLQKVIDP